MTRGAWAEAIALTNRPARTYGRAPRTVSLRESTMGTGNDCGCADGPSQIRDNSYRGGCRYARAQVARPGAARDPSPALQPSDGGSIRRLGPAVRALSRQATSRRDGGAGDQRVPDGSGGPRRRERVHAEPGAGVGALPLPPRPREAASRSGGDRAREEARAAARRVEPGAGAVGDRTDAGNPAPRLDAPPVSYTHL